MPKESAYAELLFSFERPDEVIQRSLATPDNTSFSFDFGTGEESIYDDFYGDFDLDDRFEITMDYGDGDGFFHFQENIAAVRVFNASLVGQDSDGNQMSVSLRLANFRNAFGQRVFGGSEDPLFPGALGFRLEADSIENQIVHSWGDFDSNEPHHFFLQLESLGRVARGSEGVDLRTQEAINDDSFFGTAATLEHLQSLTESQRQAYFDSLEDAFDEDNPFGTTPFEQVTFSAFSASEFEIDNSAGQDLTDFTPTGISFELDWNLTDSLADDLAYGLRVTSIPEPGSTLPLMFAIGLLTIRRRRNERSSHASSEPTFPSSR